VCRPPRLVYRAAKRSAGRPADLGAYAGCWGRGPRD
jgi:hypothetical protein